MLKDSAAGNASELTSGPYTGAVNFAAPKEKIRTVQISQMDRGYIATVGCSTIALSNKQELIHYLTQYLDNPAETEKKFLEGKLMP